MLLHAFCASGVRRTVSPVRRQYCRCGSVRGSLPQAESPQPETISINLKYTHNSGILSMDDSWCDCVCVCMVPRRTTPSTSSNEFRVSLLSLVGLNEQDASMQKVGRSVEERPPKIQVPFSVPTLRRPGATRWVSDGRDSIGSKVRTTICCLLLLLLLRRYGARIARGVAISQTIFGPTSRWWRSLPGTPSARSTQHECHQTLRPGCWGVIDFRTLLVPQNRQQLRRRGRRRPKA